MRTFDRNVRPELQADRRQFKYPPLPVGCKPYFSPAVAQACANATEVLQASRAFPGEAQIVKPEPNAANKRGAVYFVVGPLAEDIWALSDVRLALACVKAACTLVAVVLALPTRAFTASTPLVFKSVLSARRMS